jgi:hypothetical protein
MIVCLQIQPSLTRYTYLGILIYLLQFLNNFRSSKFNTDQIATID